MKQLELFEIEEEESPEDAEATRIFVAFMADLTEFRRKYPDCVDENFTARRQFEALDVRTAVVQ